MVIFLVVVHLLWVLVHMFKIYCSSLVTLGGLARI